MNLSHTSILVKSARGYTCGACDSPEGRAGLAMHEDSGVPSPQVGAHCWQSLPTGAAGVGRVE